MCDLEKQVKSSQGHPLRRKVFQTVRHKSQGFFVRVFQTLEVTIIASTPTSIFTPRTSIFVRIFQTLEVTILSFHLSNPFSCAYFKHCTRTSWTPFPAIFQTLEPFFAALKRFRARISNTRIILGSIDFVFQASEPFSKAHDMVFRVEMSNIEGRCDFYY